MWSVEDRRPAFFLQLEDQTLKAPEYLHADLLTGRRARPSFELGQPTISATDSVVEKSHRFTIHVSATNTSLVWVEKSILAMICYRHEREKWGRVGPALLAYVDDQNGSWGAHMITRIDEPA